MSLTNTLMLGAAWCVLAAAPALAAPGDIFAQPSPLFLQAPQFDKIQDSDYQPALEAGIAQQSAEIAAIADNPAAPTFDNTIVAMERSGQLLKRVDAVFSGVTGANTNPTLQAVQKAVAPEQAALDDAIYLNPKLFARVEAIYNQRDNLKLDPEARQLVMVTYDAFVHAGAKLSEADRTRLKALNAQQSVLRTEFQQRLLAATKAGGLVIDDKAKLAGLSDTQIAALAAAAEARGLKGRWVIPLQNTTQQPLLADLADRSVREALFNAGWTRAEKGDANDTREIVASLAKLRAEKARLLGYPSYAAYNVSDFMAKDPEVIDGFMRKLAPAAGARARREAADIQKVIDAEGAHFDLKPWDWERYAQRVKKARYDLSDDDTKPYFEIHKVLQDGVFYAANQLYGLTFKPRTDLPVWQPDVLVYEVHDKDGALLGLMYFDYWKRDNKGGGAWMSNFVGQSKLMGTKPVIFNVANFTKPAAGQPALISFDDVTTMFHEFGHALHGFFSDVNYPTLSGTRVARDVVEFPSQFNENWALDPKVLPHYAVHYQTGAPIPQALVDKLKASAQFNKGYDMGELIAAAELDLQWHKLSADAPKQDVDAFEAQALKAAGVDYPDVPPRYRTSYYQHIWSGGYAAGYYAYLWTEMLADDAWSWFTTHGGLTRANGQRFRDLVLSKGHTLGYGPMWRAFYGKDPDIGPMLKNRGLAE